MLFHTTHLHTNPDKQWVVFIHGAGGSSTIWHKQIKAFKEHYNLLLIDLRGHGGNEVSENINSKLEYSFPSISQEIIDVLNFLKIEKAHFIGVSLGTIIIRQIIKINESLIKSAVLTGTIIKLNLYSRSLIIIGNLTKKFVPFMALYKIFAFVIMPRENHKKSRNIFIQEAKKMKQSEFLRWFKLTKTLNKKLKQFENEIHNLPVLYLMGKQDHLFVNDSIKMVKREPLGKIEIIDNCGHIVNIEQFEIFNEMALKFIKKSST
jgi:pimeloyl-ACP methyl ester carboxylesterase